jgi:hypothetical protein
MISTYKEMDGDNLIMKNSLSFKVQRVGKVILKMTSKKLLTFYNKLYIIDIRNNLEPNSLLSKNNFKTVFKSDKFIVFENKIFIENGYLSEDLLKMNVITTIIKDEMNNNNNTFSFYLLESCDMWYDMLRYMNYNSI